MSKPITALRNAAEREPSLPTLPAGMPHLMSAMSDENVDLPGLAEIVQRFPSISARLLALANSAWAGQSRPVTSLTNACAVLGLRVVRSVSIALSVAHPFDPSRCPGFDVVRYWQSAFLTAEGAALLARHVSDVRDADTLRTAGLLHNVGLLWMAHSWPNETAAALAAAAPADGPHLAQAMQTLAGFDYCEAGGVLGEAWNLPDALTVAMRHHRSAGYRGPHWRVAAGCGAAAALTGIVTRGADAAIGQAGIPALGVGPDEAETTYLTLSAMSESVRELARTLFDA